MKSQKGGPANVKASRADCGYEDVSLAPWHVASEGEVIFQPDRVGDAEDDRHARRCNTELGEGELGRCAATAINTFESLQLVMLHPSIEIVTH